MTHAFLAALSDTLSNSGWAIMPLILVFSFVASFNPCMLAMVPVVLGGTRSKGLLTVLFFSSGFTLILVLLGVVSASVGKMIALPGPLWRIFLALLYLGMGLTMLKDKLPVKLSGFYVAKRERRRTIFHQGQLDVHPFLLGVLFGLAPSPCTVPAVTAIVAFILTTGDVLFGGVALGAFAIGHSLFIALAFLPGVRTKIASYRLPQKLKPAVAMTLLLLAVYLFIGQPSLPSHQMVNMPK